jgi:hypothetical protein
MTARRLIAALAVLLVAAAAVGFWIDRRDIGHGVSPSLTASPTASATSSDVSDAARAVTDRYLTTAQPAPVATVAGTLTISGSAVPASVEVLAVESDSRSTVLRWRLSADQTGTVTPGLFSRGTTDADTSGIALVSAQSQQRLVPGTYVQGLFKRCACAKGPYRTGPEGIEMSATFAPLPATVSEVQVRIPTFAPVTVQVTRS